jgi:hypothetical protein
MHNKLHVWELLLSVGRPGAHASTTFGAGKKRAGIIGGRFPSERSDGNNSGYTADIWFWLLMMIWIWHFTFMWLCLFLV